MADDNDPSTGNNPSTGTFGLMLGGLLALAAMIFIVTGGQLGGVKEVKGDADLPPIASPEKKN
jgi:hypothetical protein